MKIEIEKISASALKAVQIAQQKDISVCIVVTDEGGHTIYQIRMEGANFMTNEIAYRKAKTSFLFQCPSHRLRDILDNVPILAHAIQQVPGDVILLEGGLPLYLKGKIVGGIGVSGGNFEQDLLIATTFIEHWNVLTGDK